MVKPIVIFPVNQPEQEMLKLISELSRCPERKTIINGGPIGNHRDIFDKIEPMDPKLKSCITRSIWARANHFEEN